jgi:hypothetical protein
VSDFYPTDRSMSEDKMLEEKKAPNETAVDILAGDVETQGFDAPATKKLLRKLDWNIIPFMSLIYL